MRRLIELLMNTTFGMLFVGFVALAEGVARPSTGVLEHASVIVGALLLSICLARPRSELGLLGRVEHAPMVDDRTL